MDNLNSITEIVYYLETPATNANSKVTKVVIPISCPITFPLLVIFSNRRNSSTFSFTFHVIHSLSLTKMKLGRPTTLKTFNTLDFVLATGNL